MNPDRLPAAKEVKFRIFHGDADDVVTVEGSREAYKALKAAGAKVEYIEFPVAIMAAGILHSIIRASWSGCSNKRNNIIH